ncbi:hypothetical protein MRB53_014798 [Persea americana]|uniref:Uncharacterized protein n=1 Tax=Persea americana TaxID=3435 RepID=A0ACC2KBV3_PERAE|nr:hypothetical protein MRB53_014798 [Persea americana]|eukprot:TRINITY_DN14927_c0_g4_i1.p1 TRINITY_DN14927_c0_g4~~TRINITY_DN14927_c0_g4_i1.p1  ORF type:complete len:1964 (+),score=462.24 TRINITY_DN14927_c0_g4_i1:169-6060(+)
MADSSEGGENLIRLEEEYEGNIVGTSDFIFRKIGSSVPLKPSDSSFDFETAPSEALAVSERFGVVFLAHSEGFYVAKTKDVIELAKKIKEKGKGSGSIQELSIVDVTIGRVSILALSTDSSTLAACVGGEIHLFSVVSLIQKGKEPSFSHSLSESSHVKDLRWRKNEENSYVVLSTDGKLYYGDLESPLKDVMDSVDAVDWSVKGDYIAVARENTLRILSSDLKERLHMLLLFRLWANDTDHITKVDSIKWVRVDSIIIGCLQLTDDGDEEGYLVQVITNNEEGPIKASSMPCVISFCELFAGLDDQIVPCGSGPLLFASYLERWQLVLASNRKNTDQHIFSLGWSLDDNNREAAVIEFLDDKEVPRIELPENGDDNLIVGFGVDKVSLYEKIEYIKSDQEHKELYPYCVLLCLTSDGKLIMFHAARISDPSVLPTVPPGGITSVEEDSSAVVSRKPTVEDGRIETAVLDDKSSRMSKEAFDINRDDNSVLRESLKFPSLAGQPSDILTNKSSVTSDSGYQVFDSLLVASNEGREYVGTTQKCEVDAESSSSSRRQEEQDDSGTNLGISSQQNSNLGQSPVKLPAVPNFSSPFRDATKTGSQKLSSIPMVVLEDKPMPLNEKAFDINRGDDSLKESTSQVTESKESLKFPSVSGQTSGIETSKSIITSDSGDKNRDSLLVAANNEQKSLRMIQKSEIDAESNSSLTGKVHYTSGSKLEVSSQEVSKSEQLHIKPPLTQGFGSAFGDTTKTEGQKLVPTPGAFVLNPGTSVRSLVSDTSANIQQGFKDSLQGSEGGKGLTETLGSNIFQSVTSKPVSSGKLTVSNDLGARASSFASGGFIHGEKHGSTGFETGKATLIPVSQSSPSTFQSSGKNFSLKDPRASPSPSIFTSSKPIQSLGQRTATTGARTSDYASSQSILSSSQEESKLGKSHLSKGTHFLDNSKIHRSPGLLDSELQLSKSFCNVSEMVKELDILLSNIEGGGGLGGTRTAFQEHSVLELEAGLEDLSERCRIWKSTMEEKLEDIQHLLDKTMQVLAKKTYVEGIIKQASNTQYWELWNSQKLNPEFELKRHQILKLNQNLMNQIIELERHFNALELNKFGDTRRVPMGQRAFHSTSKSSRQTQSLQSLYNTMNSQLAAAEQLSECLSKQMAVLNIESPPVKKQGAAKELFESIGLPYDGDSFQSPDAKRADLTPDSSKKLPLSLFSAIKEHPRRNVSGSLKGIEPETARRRRDSLDTSLARFEPQKTTVKRMLLEEQSKFSANKPSFGIGKEIFSSPIGEGFSVSHQMGRTASSFSSSLTATNKSHPNSHPSKKDIQEKSSTQISISPSVSPFKWAKDKVGSLPVGSASHLVQQRVNMPPLSRDVAASPLSILQNNVKENMSSSQSSNTTGTYVAQSSTSMVQNSSMNETGYSVQSETLNQTSLRVSSTALATKPASPRKTVHMKTQASDFSNFKGGEFVQSKQMVGSMNPEARTLESSFSVPQKVHASLFSFQTDTPSTVQSGETATSSIISSSPPQPFTPPFPSSTSSSSSFFSASSISSSSSVGASVSSSLAEPAPLAMPFGQSVPGKGIEKTVPLPTSSSVSTSSFLPSSGPFSFQTQKQQFSPPIPSPTENVAPHSPSSQPEVLDELSSKLGPAHSASEISGGSSSGSQPSSHTTTSTFNIYGAASNAAAALNSQPETSSSAQVLFPAQSVSATQGKTEALDSTVTEEDEMEEEAPETTGLSLGALGGFGLGSTPAPSAPKPNPFGVSFGAAAASPASSQFSLTVPSGELFRPASFSFSSPTPQPSQLTSHGGFSGFGTGPTLTPSTGSAFGRPAQIGSGQQALGSVLGAFGQSRQLGPSPPGVAFASSSGFGGAGFSPAAMSGGFGSGAGFSGSATGSGFAGASKGGGFAGIASAGGGFAAAASAAGGFTAGASAGSGLAGATPGSPTGGFGAFSNSGGFSSFGGKPPSELFTQMRR